MHLWLILIFRVLICLSRYHTINMQLILNFMHKTGVLVFWSILIARQISAYNSIYTCISNELLALPPVSRSFRLKFRWQASSHNQKFGKRTHIFVVVYRVHLMTCNNKSCIHLVALFLIIGFEILVLWPPYTASLFCMLSKNNEIKP